MMKGEIKMIKKLLSYFAVLSLFVMRACTTSADASLNEVNTNNDIHETIIMEYAYGTQV